jgi:hypothetical protein
MRAPFLFFNRSGLIALQEKRNQNVQQENEKAAEEEADNTGDEGKGKSCSFASAIDGASRPRNAAESVTPAAKPDIIVRVISLTSLPKKKITLEPRDVIKKMKDRPTKVGKTGSMQERIAIQTASSADHVTTGNDRHGTQKANWRKKYVL